MCVCACVRACVWKGGTGAVLPGHSYVFLVEPDKPENKIHKHVFFIGVAIFS